MGLTINIDLLAIPGAEYVELSGVKGVFIPEVPNFKHQPRRSKADKNFDYACILWDADMRYENGSWGFYKFNGKNKWNPENNLENQKNMLNAYRVLLTRARQGIIICVPRGNSRLTPEGFPEDPTRLPEYYDGTYEYLKGLGIKEIF